MNKGDLVNSIAQQANVNKSTAAQTLDATLDAIQGALMTGEKVTLPGFGTFSTSRRSARKGRNPQTGDSIKIKARTVAKFKPGKRLRESVN